MNQPVASERPPAFPTLDVLGMTVSCTGAEGLLDHMFGGLADGRGGWLVTANLDFLRRHVRDDEARALYAQADIVVADGMPLVWAARLQGDRLPERVTGASLIWLVAERAAREGRTVYLLGGADEINQKAITVLRSRWPGIRIVGTSSPMVGSPPSPEQLESLREELVRARPDVLLVGMGSPKQEHVIRALRPALPGCWMIGVGASFSFVAGTIRRAPLWMQRVGLEWSWRLLQEPKRLARRYLVEDLPFSVELFARSFFRRFRPAPRVAAKLLPR